MRTVVVQQGVRLAGDVQSLRLRIDELRSAYSDQVRSLADEANSLIQTIAELNPQITQLESGGLGNSDAGGLRMQRLNALQRLSEIIPVRVQEQPSGAVDVFSGTDYLLLAGQYQQLETVVLAGDDGQPQLNVELSKTHSLIGSGGELGGMLDGRDQILGGFINELDQLIGGVIFEFNKIHAGGEGLLGYSTVTGTYAIDDTTAALNAAGLDFTPSHGSFQLKVRNTETGATDVFNVAIDLDGIGTDTSLEDLRTALAALDPRVSAAITNDGKLQITAADGYELRFGNDTSGVLAALGINTFFTGSDSGNIGVNDILLADQRYFATGQGGGPADNSNAVLLAQFLDNPIDDLGGVSLNEFHTAMIGSLAQSGAAEEALANGLQGFRDSLKTQREQNSGVSLDEEAIRVMELQRHYQAAARIVSTIDELLNTLLNM
jgi:flagellar hook-associated protein 1 FlgK